MDKDGTWYSAYDQLELDKRGRLMRSHFPPDKDEKFSEQLSRWYVAISYYSSFLLYIYIYFFYLINKLNSVRILPHHQNTGGFFLTVFSKSRPMPPSIAFLQAQKHRMQKNGVVDGSDEEPPAEEAEIEVAMMEELTFGMICIPSSFCSHLLLFCYFVKFTPASGKRTGKEDRHFLEKKFMPFTDEFKPLLERCNSLYGLLDNFPYSQLLIRSDEATKICILVILIFLIFNT